MQSSAVAVDFFHRIRLPGDPVPDPAAVLRVGAARFTVLTARLIRLEGTPLRGTRRPCVS